MSYFFEFDAVNKILRVSWQGQFTDEIFLEGYSAGRRLLPSLPPCKAINDFSGVTQVDITSQGIMRIAKMPPLLGTKAMLILVAPKDYLFGMSRMFSILSEETRPNLHVVRTMKEAYDLLGVDSPQFSRVAPL